MIDFAIYTKIPTSLEEMMASLHASAKGSLAGVLAVDEQELVSSDFSGHPCSSIVDAKACAQLSQNVRLNIRASEDRQIVLTLS